ncbi:glycolipid transfer protein-like [Penaeus chinensis]|uniref:glycolipid transfer protein-like n=1 Tax=Penaeus chinensis TaxID=139456 RepID=UPI001FB6356B|nr:glycolipid transfer protein-like [Penaeus chinensis]
MTLPQPDSPNFFSQISHTYPVVTQDGKIETEMFLEASKSFIQIYDLLGAAFYVVKKDMSGNIEKIYKAYNCNPEKNKYLNDLICEEKEVQDSVIVDALLWLKRALEFTVIFINGICDEFEKGTGSERLDHLATDAYNVTLKKYHKWIVQNIFKMVVKSVPTRSVLVKALYFGKGGPEDTLFKDCRVYIKQLETNLSVIVQMYDEWGLNNDNKV